jgi:hypothetical protein
MHLLWHICHGLTALPYTQLKELGATHVAGGLFAPLVGLELRWHEAQVR